MKISMMVLVLFTLTAQLLMAENKKEESYNYKRGVELLLEDDDMERGLSFLNKEIADHKDNGYAHLWISKVYFRQEKYGPALDAVYKACLFSLIDNPQQALQYLSLYFEGNGSNSIHVRRDPVLEPVRRLPEFEALMQDFESKWKAEQSTLTEAAEYEEELIEIPFTMEGGICKVKCSINGLPLYFYFDTGASDIGISSVEAAFMLKNGYLDNSDFYGKAYYTNANGDIFEGTNIRLREINFGGLVLKDVRASVAKSQKAPLLLGQTALQRLGKIEIDNERKVLRVNRMVKKN